MRIKSEAEIYLEQVEKCDSMIRNKLIEKEQWHDLAMSITAQMNGERVQSSGAKDKMARAVERCVDMEDEIDRSVARLVSKKKEVTQTIEELYSPVEYDVLHKRYILYMTLQDIADHYDRDYDWAKVTCKRARNHVQAILNKKNMQPRVTQTP